MIKILPILTEKSLAIAKEGRYSFLVPRNLTKNQIKKIVNKAFGVHVVHVATLKKAGEDKRNFKGEKQRLMPKKKAIVILKDKEKIDLFDVKEK